MQNSEPISAIYEDGVLKPSQPLMLRERQEVTILVLDEETATGDDARLRAMQQRLEAWRAFQPEQSSLQPPALSAATRARLDAEFDQLLGELRKNAEHDTEAMIALVVDEAVNTVRHERRRR